MAAVAQLGRAFCVFGRSFWRALSPNTRRAVASLGLVAAAIAATTLIDLKTAVVGTVAALYLLPTIVAAGREHETIAGIFVLNLLLGWTLIGWVVALSWAFSKPRISLM